LRSNAKAIARRRRARREALRQIVDPATCSRSDPGIKESIGHDRCLSQIAITRAPGDRPASGERLRGRRPGRPGSDRVYRATTGGFPNAVPTNQDSFGSTMLRIARGRLAGVILAVPVDCHVVARLSHIRRRISNMTICPGRPTPPSSLRVRKQYNCSGHRNGKGIQGWAISFRCPLSRRSRTTRCMRRVISPSSIKINGRRLKPC